MKIDKRHKLKYPFIELAKVGSRGGRLCQCGKYKEYDEPVFIEIKSKFKQVDCACQRLKGTEFEWAMCN